MLRRRLLRNLEHKGARGQRLIPRGETATAPLSLPVPRTTLKTADTPAPTGK
jgi:hypothetical protein